MVSWGQIISWDFTSGNTPNVNLPGGTTALTFNTGGTNGTTGCTGNGFSTSGWNVNEYLQIVAPTTGYNITTMTFNVRSSGTGPWNFKVQYSSTGTGGTFTDLGTTFQSGNGVCVGGSADFTAINVLDNNANTVIRLVFTGGEADGSPATGDAAAAGTFRIDDLIINGSSSCTAPSTQASAITTSGETLDGFNVNWTAGNGNGTMIVVKPSPVVAPPPQTLPASGTAYTPNLAWGSAGQIDTNNRVVFRGAGTSAGPITGLASGSQYTVYAYEYNTVGNCYNLTTALGTGYTRAVEPSGHAASFICTTASTTQINLSFSAASTITNAAGYIILQSTTGVPTGIPTDGNFYPGGTVIGDATVVTYVGVGSTSYNVTGLTPSTTYYFTLIPYNSFLSVPVTLNYNTNPIIPNTNCTTYSLSPPVITSSLIASGNQGSPFTYNITATNVPTSYNAAVLPAGLSINTTTGVISGTPSVSGTFNVTITATNGFGSDNETLVITLGTGPCLSEAFAVNALPSGWVQNTITFTSNYAEFGGNNSELTTVSVSNPASLTFTLARTTNTTAKDLIVEVSTTSQVAGFTTVSTYNHGNTTSGGTTNCTVDLSAYTSFSTVYIRFRKSSATTSPWRLDDIQVFCGTPCTPATIAATPSSGPVGTEVTITASTGSLTGATVSFGAINATIISNNGTEMVVIVPNGATTGVIKVTDAQPCDATTPFAVISSDNTSCEGASSITDLIIYDIHDEKTGSGGFITLYNGTASTVDLTNYSIYRTTSHDDGNEVDYANLTGTIAPGALGILKVSVGSCGPASTNGTIDGGFNEDDGIQLRNAAGTVVIDDVDTYPTAPGYYMVRNSGALNARTSYVAADWSTIPLAAGECYPSAGLTLPSVGTPPVVTTHPTYTPSCGSTSATLNTAGTEGFVGGNSLAYQWYVVAPGSTTWTAVTNGGIYSGATSTSLNISVITGVINYQYYCQIRENSATCYSATNAIKITDTSASTWNGTTWSNGIPSLTKAAIIDGTYVTATNGDFSCCSLTINATRSLTISSGGYVEVQNNVTNNGTFNILNNGSLVQVDDNGINTGNINMERIANIRLHDYVYWSVPTSGAGGVANFPITSVSPSTPTSVLWKWAPVNVNANGGQGTWINTTENMVKGYGYIVRGPSGTSTTVTTPLNVNFIGVPNNGVIPVTIQRGNDLNAGTPGPNGVMRTIKDDNYNLVGNPYASAIDADLFIDTYGNPSNPAFYADIEGSVRIWTHNSLPLASNVDPFYGDYQLNYTANDYIVYNSLGSQTGPYTFNGKIAAGQSFFVVMNDGPVGTNTITFKNSLRNRTYNNSQFFRSNSNSIQASNEKHRIWLDLVSASNSVVRTLVGYSNGATNLKDNTFDAITDPKIGYNLYSVLDSEVLTIQGRALPFDVQDQVRLGVAIPTAGNYKIAIAMADGMFSNTSGGGQKIYLEDKDLNIIHDLTTGPYVFTANQGKHNTRFILRYTESTLSNDLISNSENDVVVFTNDYINVQSKNENMTNVEVYDVLGRIIFKTDNVNDKNFKVMMTKNNAPLIIKVTLENGLTICKKIIY